MSTFEGKTAIITGGAGNLGRTTAKRLLSEGANVVLVDLDSQELDNVRAELEHDEQIMTVKADVTDEDDVQNYVSKTQEKFGSIDILFNNAGIIGDVASLTEQSLANFTKVLSINTTGIFLGLKHVLPVMQKQGNGSVINTSSVDGLRGSPNLSPYSASKHAVIGLTKTAALEVAGDNVRVNSIHPAPVSGAMMETVEEGVNRKDILSGIPVGKYATSDDIAEVVAFLASDASKYVTGSQYRVDGGMGAVS